MVLEYLNQIEKYNISGIDLYFINFTISLIKDIFFINKDFSCFSQSYENDYLRKCYFIFNDFTLLIKILKEDKFNTRVVERRISLLSQILSNTKTVPYTNRKFLNESIYFSFNEKEKSLNTKLSEYSLSYEYSEQQKDISITSNKALDSPSVLFMREVDQILEKEIHNMHTNEQILSKNKDIKTLTCFSDLKENRNNQFHSISHFYTNHKYKF